MSDLSTTPSLGEWTFAPQELYGSSLGPIVSMECLLRYANHIPGRIGNPLTRDTVLAVEINSTAPVYMQFTQGPPLAIDPFDRESWRYHLVFCIIDRMAVQNLFHHLPIPWLIWTANNHLKLLKIIGADFTEYEVRKAVGCLVQLGKVGMNKNCVCPNDGRKRFHNVECRAITNHMPVDSETVQIASYVDNYVQGYKIGHNRGYIDGYSDCYKSYAGSPSQPHKGGTMKDSVSGFPANSASGSSHDISESPVLSILDTNYSSPSNTHSSTSTPYHSTPDSANSPNTVAESFASSNILAGNTNKEITMAGNLMYSTPSTLYHTTADNAFWPHTVADNANFNPTLAAHVMFPSPPVDHHNLNSGALEIEATSREAHFDASNWNYFRQH